MEAAFKKLAGLFKEEIKIVRELLRLAELKKQALVETDIKALERVIDEETHVTGYVKSIERRRERLIELISAKGLLADSEPSLTAIVRAAPEGMAEEFRAIKAEMTAVLEELAGLNTLNRLLTQQSLDHVETVLTVLTRNPESASTYTGRGKAGDVKPLCIVNRVV